MKRRLDRQPPERSRLTRQESKQARPHDAQEARAADALPDGKRTPGSGCGWSPSKKSDATGHLFRSECKTVEDAGAKSITILRADLAKAKAEALMMDQCPAFVFGWPGKAWNDGEDWVAFPLARAKALMQMASCLSRGDYDGAIEWLEGVV